MFFKKKNKPEKNQPEKTRLPEVYSEAELEAVEKHISSYFGGYETVLHEIESPDIHVDICIIPPAEGRPYQTLVTLGMGAHKMNVPDELAEWKLERAELIVTLPADWDFQTEDERLYWPVHLQKVLARFPGEYDTWLGYGHTIPNGKPFADNTELNSVMLVMPYLFGEPSYRCTLPNGEEVVFYQMIPLYESELNYKKANNADALDSLFPDEINMGLDINRNPVV